MRRKKESPSHERYRSDFPSRLRALMEEQHKTHQDVADFLGKSRQTVGFYANGTSSPDWETIVQLAKFFHVTSDFLLGLSEFTATETANLTATDMGLSERAAIILADFRRSDNPVDRKKIKAVNLLIEDDGIDEWGTQLLLNLARYLYVDAVPHQIVRFSTDGIDLPDSEETSAVDLLSTDYEFANALYNQLLENRVISSVKGAQYQVQHPMSMTEMCNPERVIKQQRYPLKGDSEHGKH